MPKRVRYTGSSPYALGSAEGLSQEYCLEPGVEVEVPDEDVSKLSRFLGDKLRLMREVAAEANTGEPRSSPPPVVVTPATAVASATGQGGKGKG